MFKLCADQCVHSVSSKIYTHTHTHQYKVNLHSISLNIILMQNARLTSNIILHIYRSVSNRKGKHKIDAKFIYTSVSATHSHTHTHTFEMYVFYNHLTQPNPII